MGAVDNPFRFSLESMEKRIRNTVTDVAGKSELQLRDMYVRALNLESHIKSEINLLRQRAANEVIDGNTMAEETVIKAKGYLADLLDKIRTIEASLHGKVGDFSTAATIGDGKTNDNK